MNGKGTDIWDVADQFRFAYKSLSGNGSIIARVDSVAPTDPWSKAGVMIRETLDAGSAHAFVTATPTPSHGVSYQRRVAAGGTSTNTDVDMLGVALPYWVKLTRTGTTLAAQRSLDGVTWTDITVSPALTFTMGSNVYIGLAVTSHMASAACGAKFSNVSTTGGVTGSWQVAEIGVPQVQGNTPETFYVALQDSAGKMKVVSNPDPTVIATGVWQEWSIPLTQFTSAGVNVGSIKRMVIGVGDRSSPKAGAAGKLYIDDIRLTRVGTP
jgi:regulation of enolase protein 1 (concanavalin A-like superfamily)